MRLIPETEVTMRVLGESVARCDATLVRGRVAVVDPEISGWNDVVYLSEQGLSRFREVELLPREWLRLATRISPHYRLLAGERYSRFGEAEFTDRTGDDLKGHTRFVRFPSVAEIATSPKTAVLVGVAWSAEDLLAETGEGSLHQVINQHTPDSLYASLDSLIARKRQVDEIRDLCYRIVERLVDSPRPDWVARQWLIHGRKCFGTLIDLSLRVWHWEFVEQKATQILAGIPGDQRRWETTGWHHLMLAAPARERARLRDLFLRGVPETEQDRVAGWLEHPGA
jgi:hypothetical protein